MANIIESRVTLEDEVFEETIDTMEEPIEVVRPSSYNDLEDLPQVNGVTLMGNKTSEELGIVTATDIENAVSAEATLRENADTALGGRIDGEKTARENADTALGGRIDTEITNRTNADNALGTRIDNEILARQGGDNNLQTQIDAITSKSDVVDVVADYAALQAYDTQHLGNNDVIKVLDDETHNDAQTYYRWNKTAGTWSYIGSEAPYYSKGQIDQQMQAKQDKLTAGTGITLDGSTISADTTVLATKEDLEPEIVAALPAVGDTTKLYLTPTNKTASGNPITIDLKEDVGQMTSFQLDGDTFQKSYTGKNLWSATTLVTGYYKFADGDLVTGGNPNYVTSIEKIDVTAGESYHISADKGVGVAGCGCVFFNNDTFVSSSVNPSGSNFTVPDGANKMAFNFFNNAGLNPSEVTHIQLEAGSTATSYEPYVGGTYSPNPDYPQQVQTVTGVQTISINGTDYPLDLGTIELCKLGNYKDYIYKDGDTWKVHKATGSRTFDGSENWTYDDARIPRIYLSENALNNLNIHPAIPSSTATQLIGKITNFTAKTFVDFYTNAQGDGFAMSTVGRNIQMGDNRWTSRDGAIAEVIGAKWYYAQATGYATDTAITDQTLIAQLETIRTAALGNGANTITNTATGTNLAGSMSIGYYGYNPSEYSEWLYVDGAWEQVGGRPFPTNISELENDADFVSENELQDIIAPKLQTEIVNELPAQGNEGKLYLTPKNYTRSTAIGNPITATVTEQAGQMESFQLDGDTFQQTYTGKNLCGIPDQTFTDQGITVTIKDGEVTINGTTTGASTNSIPFIESTVLDGDYTTNLIYVSGSKSDSSANVNLRRDSDHTLVNGTQTDINGGNSYRTYSISNESVELGFYAQRGTVFDNLKFKIQIVASSTPDYDFEPYVGGVPAPNPEYPQPIQTVTGEQTVTVVGKNLISASWESGRYNNSTGAKEPYSDNVRTDAPIAVQPNTTYICSRNGSGLAMNILQYKAGGSFISTTTISSGNSFTTGADTYFVAMFRGTSGGTEGIQLELGSTITSYAPYHATSYPINLGKNLFDRDSAGYGNIMADGTINDSTNYVRSDYIPISPNSVYTLSASFPSGFATDPYIRMAFYDANKNFITRPSVQGNLTATSPSNAFYCMIAMRQEATDIQLETGSTATAYAPYKTPIELCKLGTYQDYIYKDGEDWKIHKATKTKVYDGTNQGFDYRARTSNSDKYRFQFEGSVEERSIAKTSSGEYFVGLCNGLPAGSRDMTYNAQYLDGNVIAPITDSSYGNIGVIYAATISAMTLEEANTWLTTHNMIVTYALATPTDTTITDTDLIAQLEAIRTASLENGTNTITNSTPAPNLAGDMELGYYEYDPTNRYNKWLWLDLNNNYEKLGS